MPNIPGLFKGVVQQVHSSVLQRQDATIFQRYELMVSTRLNLSPKIASTCINRPKNRQDQTNWIKTCGPKFFLDPIKWIQKRRQKPPRHQQQLFCQVRLGRHVLQDVHHGAPGSSDGGAKDLTWRQMWPKTALKNGVNQWTNKNWRRQNWVENSQQFSKTSKFWVGKLPFASNWLRRFFGLVSEETEVLRRKNLCQAEFVGSVKLCNSKLTKLIILCHVSHSFRSFSDLIQPKIWVNILVTYPRKRKQPVLHCLKKANILVAHQKMARLALRWRHRRPSWACWWPQRRTPENRFLLQLEKRGTSAVFDEVLGKCLDILGLLSELGIVCAIVCHFWSNLNMYRKHSRNAS